MTRNTTPTDVLAVALLIFQAMEETVYKMIDKPHKEETITLLTQLFAQKGNQYSCENARVYEGAGDVVGSVIAYGGAQLHALRAPVLTPIRSSYGIDTVLKDETATGELYIDMLSVSPRTQGCGIGSKLVCHLCGVDSQPLGLLANVNNLEAGRLYSRLGLEYTNHQELAGGVYKHLILKI